MKYYLAEGYILLYLNKTGQTSSIKVTVKFCQNIRSIACVNQEHKSSDEILYVSKTEQYVCIVENYIRKCLNINLQC